MMLVDVPWPEPREELSVEAPHATACGSAEMITTRLP
jgi:hypothetical protein